MSDSNSDAPTKDSSDSSTDGFVTALGIGAAVGLIFLILFCYLRTRIPDVFELRLLLNTWKSHNDFNGNRVGVVEPRPSTAFFGWVKPVFQTSEEEVVNKIGMDAALFFRFIRTSFFIAAIISLYGLILLMPVYGTGRNRDNDASINGLRLVTLSNVEPSNGRFWLTTITEFLVAALLIALQSRDFQHYTKLRRKYRKTENPANYSLVVYDIPVESRNEAAIRDRFECIIPGQVANVVVIRNPSQALKLQKKLDNAVNKRESAENKLSVKGEEPKVKTGPLASINCFAPKVDAISHWSQEQDQFANAINDLESTAAATPSAIVVCSNKKAASILAQANSRTSATKWHVERAPEPGAIHWGAFLVPGFQGEMRSIAVAIFVLFFTIFWTVPAALIVGLASLEDLTETAAFEWARPIIEWNSYLLGLVEGLLPPIVMAVLVSLIPVIFRAVIGFERISSASKIEVRTRDYFYMFTLFGTFFVYLLGAAFFQDLNALAEKWTKIVDLLAVAVPGSGIYFATLILLKSLIPIPMYMSGLVRCIIRWVKLKFLAKTERQIRGARSGGSEFPYFRHYGFGMLVLFLCLAFSSLAPIVPMAGTIYFGLSYVCLRYSILFASYNPWDGGGEAFPGTFWGTMLGLILKQAVVIAVLSLKKAGAPAAVCFVPLVITACFTMIVSKRYERIGENGSLLDLYEEGQKSHEVPHRYQHVYEQPAGKITNYENLNGVVDVKDVYPEVELGRSKGRDNTVHPETFDDNVGYVPDTAADREEI